MNMTSQARLGERAMIDKYIVIGNPIGHSLSPQIHSQFAKQTGEQLSYTTVLAELGQFNTAVDKFHAEGGKGCNVTVPFKEDAFQYVTEHSIRAALAGAINTIVLNKDGSSYGDNTDGIGLINDITINHNYSLKNKNVLLLGAGGAARGVVAPLVNAGINKLTIANRTVQRAELLAQEQSEHLAIQDIIYGCGFSEAKEQYDVIINASSSSLHGETPPLADNILTSSAFCYDLMYSKESTPFMLWGERQGAEVVVDGLGMLVEQAAEAFLLWRGVRPDSQAVIETLKKNII